MSRKKQSNASIPSDMHEYDEDEESEVDDEEEEEEEDDDDPHVVRIVVKLVGKGEGNPVELTMPATSSVLDLKKLITQELGVRKENVPTQRQRLIFFGRMLKNDDEELGPGGLGMKDDDVNYIHLSPLPEGATPSRRQKETSSVSTQSTVLDPPPVELQSQLGRARRLGAAARERRRRRRPQPYSVSRNTQEAPPAAPERAAPAVTARATTTAAAAGPEAEGTGTPARSLHPPLRQVRLPTEENPAQLFQLSASEVYTLPIMQHSAVLPLGPFTPPLPTISHLTELTASGAVASARRQAHATSLLQAQLHDHIRQAYTDLANSLPLLQAQLRAQLQAISASSDLLDPREVDLNTTVNMLESISRETASLAASLRPLATPPPAVAGIASPLVALTAATPATTLEHLLGGVEMARAIPMPGGASFFQAGPTVPRTL